jgi:hypothetical protein
MNKWKEELTAIAKRCIEAEKKCRANPCGWQSCGPRDTPEWKEYAILSATWQDAESDLWRATDVEYDDKDPLRAACWEWRYAKVMARKCTWYLLKDGNSKWAGETMQKLHMTEMNLMGLLGLLAEYKAPCHYIEEQFPRLKKSQLTK